DRGEDVLARPVGDGGVAAQVVARDHRVAAVVRVVDEEEPARLVVGREGDAQEPPLATAGDLARDVEERGRLKDVVLDDADAPRLLDHEHAVRIEPGGRHRGRLLEPRRDAHGVKRRAGDRGHAGADGRRVLELTGRRAAVAAHQVAVVALLATLRDAVAARPGRRGRAVRRRRRTPRRDPGSRVVREAREVRAVDVARADREADVDRPLGPGHAVRPCGAAAGHDEQASVLRTRMEDDPAYAGGGGAVVVAVTRVARRAAEPDPVRGIEGYRARRAVARAGPGDLESGAHR